MKDFWFKSARELRLPRYEYLLQAKSLTHQVSWTSAGSAHMPFIFIKKLKFSLQRGHQSTRLPARPNSTRSWRIPQYWKLRTHWLTLGRATNATPPKMWMPVVSQITKLPSQLNFYKFSPHAFHLDKKSWSFRCRGVTKSPGHQLVLNSTDCWGWLLKNSPGHFFPPCKTFSTHSHHCCHSIAIWVQGEVSQPL